MSDSSNLTKVIDPKNPPKVEYCVPTWVRDEQIKLAIQRPIARIQPAKELKTEPIACVGFGPSLHDTWGAIKDFKYVMTCSGSHKFLVERGITPAFHVEVDPREHKVGLIGQPCKETQYLIASACHPKVFDHLRDYHVVLWHIFDGTEEHQRIIPANEWSVTGGCSVGVRMLTLSRLLGFTDLHIFGMDGSEHEVHGKHADKHPMQPPGHSLVTYEGREFKTTSSMFTVAQGLFHELDMLPDVKPTFHGDGLIQHMAKFYERKPIKPGTANLAIAKPELISSEYKELNRKLHQENIFYGVGGAKHKETVLKIAEKLGTTSILDYGCGKGFLAKEIPFPIWEYDPAIPGKDAAPRPADLVVCSDVLEHIEPDHLLHVLADLQRVVKKCGFFIIHTGAAQKTLPDGRNTHLIQQGKQWWKNRLKAFFTVGSIQEKGKELYCVVGPKAMSKSVAA
jgi:hypothetical protein